MNYVQCLNKETEEVGVHFDRVSSYASSAFVNEYLLLPLREMNISMQEGIECLPQGITRTHPWLSFKWLSCIIQTSVAKHALTTLVLSYEI